MLIVAQRYPHHWFGVTELTAVRLRRLCFSVSGCVLRTVLWQKLTLSLIRESNGGSAPTLQEVTAKFEELYQGTASVPGLKDVETLIPARGTKGEVFMVRGLGGAGRSPAYNRCSTMLVNPMPKMNSVHVRHPKYMRGM